MKDKSSVLEVPEPPQTAPQMKRPEPLYKGLTSIERLIPFLEMSGTSPSPTDCEDLNLTAFENASALVELVAWGEEALQNQVGNSVEPSLTRAAEAITLQLEIMRLTSKTLFELVHGDRVANKLQ